MSNIFDVFVSQLYKDFYILICAIVTLIILIVAHILANRLEEELNPSQRKANPKPQKQTPEDFEDIILKKRKHMNLFYTLFVNLTSLFPLFGMLGTVFGLIGVAGDLGETDINHFFGALTSTAWGILFSIAYKIADSWISVKVMRNDKEVDTLLQRNTKRKHSKEGVTV